MEKWEQEVEAILARLHESEDAPEQLDTTDMETLVAQMSADVEHYVRYLHIVALVYLPEQAAEDAREILTFLSRWIPRMERMERMECTEEGIFAKEIEYTKLIVRFGRLLEHLSAQGG